MDDFRYSELSDEEIEDKVIAIQQVMPEIGERINASRNIEVARNHHS